MTPDLRPQDPAAGTSLAERAYLQLDEMIVTSALAPGSTVSETMLTQRLGIGRTPVREALQRLANEGMLAIVPRCGIVIAEIEPDTLLELRTVRRELERFTAQRAIRQADAEVFRRIAGLAERFEAAAANADELTFIRADKEFDSTLSIAARNEYAYQAVRPLRAQIRRLGFLYRASCGDLACLSRHHAEIAHAVVARDEARARAAVDTLIDYSHDFTRRAGEVHRQRLAEAQAQAQQAAAETAAEA